MSVFKSFILIIVIIGGAFVISTTPKKSVHYKEQNQSFAGFNNVGSFESLNVAVPNSKKTVDFGVEKLFKKNKAEDLGFKKHELGNIVGGMKRNSLSSENKNTQSDDIGLNLILPVGYQVNTSESATRIYISNNANNQIIGCSVDKENYDTESTVGSNHSGQVPVALYNCSIALDNIGSPMNLLINNNNIYLLNQDKNYDGYVMSCRIGSTNKLQDCTNMNVLLNSVTYIYSGSSSQVIITDFPMQGFVDINSCVTNKKGAVILCGSPSKTNVYELPSRVINGYEYKIKIIGQKNVIYKCVSNTCTVIKNDLFNSLSSMYVSEDTAYITTFDGRLVSCGVDQSSGEFFACQNLATNLNTPMGIIEYNKQ
jgi:hypothetical protein